MNTAQSQEDIQISELERLSSRLDSATTFDDKVAMYSYIYTTLVSELQNTQHIQHTCRILDLDENGKIQLDKDSLPITQPLTLCHE